MHGERLPKRMCMELKELSNGNPTNDNLNSVVQLKIILKRAEHSYLWQLQDPGAITKALSNIQGVFARTSWHEDIAKALSSGYCPMYKIIRDLPDSPTCEDNILENHPLSHTRALASCRLAGELFLKFNLESTYHRIIQTETCFACNFGAKETLLHIFNESFAYASYRTKYLKDSNVLIILFRGLPEDMPKLFHFITNMLKARSFTVNDCLS
ncbi:hypothetical protein QAD02_007352 [Eretmocerus hayati]|uniref:Uncharacterized protein n=1 Tax=Eretmocerus hayati TaxID=131215 RepID=A0ACC2N3D7_9HYME|nr:hypothetical protein QAD02_007352 [Eretmocerus hayati]